MRKHEISDLIGLARGFDDRVEEVADPWWSAEQERWIEDARLAAWELVLGGIDFALAKAGLVELYRSPQMMRLQPGHVFDAAEKVRRRNVAAVDVGQLLPPDGLDGEENDPDAGSRSAQWRQAAVEAAGRGASLEQAQQVADHALGVERRVLGPPVRKLELEARPRGLGKA